MSDHDGWGPEGSYFEHKARREEEARRARGGRDVPGVDHGFVPGAGLCVRAVASGMAGVSDGADHYMHFDSQWERLTNPVTVTLFYLVLGSSSGCGIRAGWCFWPSPLGEMYKS